MYDIYVQGQSKDHPDYASWRFPSWDNPAVYPGGRNDPELKLVEATASEDWFLQEYAAEFTAFVGKIFAEWNEDTHVLPDYKFNPDWPNYVCFDWGYVNPLAAIEFQIAPDDTIIVWREHYRSYMRLEDHLRLMARREQPEGYHINMCFGDAADPEATATVCEKFAPCISNPDSKTNWREGIDLVKLFLKKRAIDRSEAVYPGESEEADGLEAPGFFVVRCCPNTIREFNNYRAPNTINTRSPRNPREDAQKYDDHALDAIRYGLMHIYKLGATHHLSDVVVPETPAELVTPAQALVVPNAGDLAAVMGYTGTDDTGWFHTSDLSF